MLTITLPLPHKLLSPNQTPHPVVFRRLKRKARGDAQIAALVALQTAGMADSPRWTAVTVECRVYCTTQRRRDADNFTASMKAAMDGLTDAGIWTDDSVVRPLAPVFGIDKQQPRVEVVVRPL